jgi:hypothetical protein
VPPITVIPPHDADAKPVPSSAVPADVRKQIAESLASAPKVVSDRGTALFVADTGGGTKTVKESDDIDSAVDDAAESIVRGAKESKRSSDALITQKSNKQPAYLKSVSHPVVHNPANKEAPYGYDDNDRPIGVPVGNPYVKPVQTGTVERGERGPLCSCNQLLCRYCHPENIARTKVLESLMHDYDQVEVTSSVSEASLRRLWGLPNYTPTVKIDPLNEFIYYPELLGVTRAKLVELLDVQVSVDIAKTIGKERILKTTTAIEARIAQLLRIPKQIEEYKKLIHESEELIRSWSAHVMKLRRTEEDRLDKPTRERYKREERARIFRCKDELSELRRLYAGLDGLQQRLAAWGSSPNDYELNPVIQHREVPMSFADKFKSPKGFTGILPAGHEYGVGAYRQIVYAYDADKTATEQRVEAESSKFWRPWRRFENEIVLQAVGWRLICPSEKLLAAHPSLGKYLDRWSDGIATEAAGILNNGDEAENALILKTGGAQIGGGVYGTKGTRLKSFDKYDKNFRRGNDRRETALGFERPDNFYNGMDSGDLAERRGDE